MKSQRIKKLNEEIIESFSQEKLLLGHGRLDSKLMLIGEAPGAREIELRQPFVGQAGRHLDKFLEAVDIGRKDVYITNVVKYRPIKENKKTGRLSNRTPTKEEIDNFKGYLYEEVIIVNPKIVVTLGNIPLQALFNENLKIGEIHGALMKVQLWDRWYKVFPLYHPAAVIYRPELREVYLEDLFALKEIVDNI
ncbi:MAG TPA: uracil-DNA glycosylase [Tepidimicrobium sp.]|nr:uracil-DNA glycosylase [Tepidimicrobium sp.]